MTDANYALNYLEKGKKKGSVHNCYNKADFCNGFRVIIKVVNTQKAKRSGSKQDIIIALECFYPLMFFCKIILVR